MTIEAGGNAPINVRGLSFSYGRKTVFENVSFQVPEGALYALLGPNGAGKTTLMQVLIGILRTYRGHAVVNGRECSMMRVQDRQRMGYVAEGLKLPAWMRLEQLEAYLAPLYPTWDRTHATTLRERFELDPKAKIGKMSRGQYMKAALLCALASRPKLLVLDEPFTGMDVGVKDELVRGLLAASSGEGCTILLASHDIGELELLADWVGFLGEQSMQLSESMDSLRGRFKQVDVVLPSSAKLVDSLPSTWLSVEQSGAHLKFVVSDAGADFEQRVLRPQFLNAMRVEVREATLKEVFLAVQRSAKGSAGSMAVAS
ncbi:MAG: ABC transporter ATP-binding protein [Gemmatimonas sp.]